MSRIVVFGDTHLVYGRRSDLYEQLVSDLADCDLAIHTGDLVTVSTLEMLEDLAEIVAVYGNVCFSEIRLRLRRREIVEVDGVRIGVLHGDGGASAYHTARAAFRGEELDLVRVWPQPPKTQGDIQRQIAAEPRIGVPAPRRKSVSRHCQYASGALGRVRDRGLSLRPRLL